MSDHHCTRYTMPQRMIDASICAYSVSIDGTFTPDEVYYDPIGLETKPDTFDGGKYEIDAGFVGTTKADADTGERWVVLSFRGTLAAIDWEDSKSVLAFFSDWYQDDETRHAALILNGKNVGSVEKGFKLAVDTIWPEITKYLDDVDWAKVSGIQITGHSKGAGMTFIAAAMIKAQYSAASKICVHAYAAPLTGDPKFAAWYRKQGLDSTTIRYQRIYDIVPFLPPSVNWNIFKYLPDTLHPSGLLMELSLKLLKAMVHGGFEEVGALVALVTNDPRNSKMRIGGEKFLQNSIKHAIYLGEAKKVAGAHSAIDSYWPSLFPADCKLA